MEAAGCERGNGARGGIEPNTKTPDITNTFQMPKFLCPQPYPNARVMQWFGSRFDNMDTMYIMHIRKRSAKVRYRCIQSHPLCLLLRTPGLVSSGS